MYSTSYSMPIQHMTLLLQQPCTQAVCTHTSSNNTARTMGYVRQGPAQQSQLPLHYSQSLAASCTTSACRVPHSTVQTTAASSSKSNSAGSMSHDNPLALAFLGDAIWSLCVRRHFLNPPKHHSLYQGAVRPYVTAEGQAALYDQLLSSSSSSSNDGSHGTSIQLQLTPGEAALLRRIAAWKAVKLRKRFASPAAAATYRKATALEALVGHLHLNDPQRLEQLVQALLPPPPNGTRPSSSSPSPQQTQDEGAS